VVTSNRDKFVSTPRAKPNKPPANQPDRHQRGGRIHNQHEPLLAGHHRLVAAVRDETVAFSSRNLTSALSSRSATVS
jgi:hypothetical protein